MARGKQKKGPERTENDAARRPIHDDAPGEARVRGSEERTPGENVLGEDLRAEDELLGDPPRSLDDVLAHAESEAVPDRIAEEQQARLDVDAVRDEGELFRGREAPRTRGHGSGDLADVEDEPGFEGLREPEQVLAFGSLDEPDDQGPLARDLESGLEPTDLQLDTAEEELREVDVREGAPATGDVDEGIVAPAGREGASNFGQGRGRAAGDERLGAAESPDADPEKVERAAAWEHAPDLETTSMILERGEGEAGSRAVSRPVDQAQFDPVSSAAYDEPTPGTIDLQVPGAGITMDRTERTADAAAPGPATGSGGKHDIEPPPDSVREVQRPHEVAAEPNDTATRQRATTRRTKKTKGESTSAKKKTKSATDAPAERPRRRSRRSSPKREQQPGTQQAGSPE